MSSGAWRSRTVVSVRLFTTVIRQGGRLDPQLHLALCGYDRARIRNQSHTDVRSG